MKLSEIYKIADESAPKALSDEYCAKYGAYDNSGILVDCGEEIRGVVFSLDLSNAAIDRAIETGANLIVTHHPAIYGKISEVRFDDAKLLGGKLVKCLKAGISVIAMHLNLDGAKDGIDENLAAGICCSAGGELGEYACLHPLSGGGYGRAYDLPEIGFYELVGNMKKTFSSERILAYGEKGRKISRVASFCGAGADEGSVLFAKNAGAEVIISADFKHHVLSLALESGLAVIVLTHYASENYGFEKYYKKIRRQLEIPCVYHTDSELL